VRSHYLFRAQLLLTLFIGWASLSISCGSFSADDSLLFKKGSVETLLMLTPSGRQIGSIRKVTDECHGSGDTMFSTVSYHEYSNLLRDSVLCIEHYRLLKDTIYYDMGALANYMVSSKPGVHKERRVFGEPLIYPLGMRSGDSLPGSIIWVTTRDSGQNDSLIAKIKDRKVEGTETIKVGSKKFNCFRISYCQEIDCYLGVVYGFGPLTKIYFEEWFSPECGVVRDKEYYRASRKDSELAAWKDMSEFVGK
jgi:hypothetical protein